MPRLSISSCRTTLRVIATERRALLPFVQQSGRRLA